MKPDLTSIFAGKAAHETGVSAFDGFDLGAEQFDPALEAIEHRVFEECFAVGRKLLGSMIR